MSKIKPKVILIAAITIDGKIAKSEKHKADWTSEEDKQYFRNETQRAGVIIFGRTTFETLKRPLLNRLNIVITNDPSKYISQEKQGLLEFTADSPQKVVDNLAQRGYTSIVIGGGMTIYSLFLKSGLIDEIHLTIAPRIFGKGIPLFWELDKDVECELMSVERLGKEEVLVKYKIKK